MYCLSYVLMYYLRGRLLFEITFANSRGGPLFDIKPTGLVFEVLQYPLLSIRDLLAG